MATTAKEWKKKNKAHELQLPSGNTCLVRRPGPSVFMQQGMMPNSLLGVVMPLLEDAREKGKLEGGAPLPQEAFVALEKDIIENPEKLTDMFALADNITVACVVAPVVHPVSLRNEILADDSLNDEEKQAKIDDHLFVDDVDDEDKLFIMNFVVGGTADLDRFREGAEALVAAGQDGPEVPDSTE